jgi:hypothetical protein
VQINKTVGGVENLLYQKPEPHSIANTEGMWEGEGKESVEGQ